MAERSRRMRTRGWDGDEEDATTAGGAPRDTIRSIGPNAPSPRPASDPHLNNPDALAKMKAHACARVMRRAVEIDEGGSGV